MSIELDPQEVLEHLYSLGYYNITKEQLKEFVKDLKKLIKYDLRKEDRKNRFVHEDIQKSNKENIGICSGSTPTKDRSSSSKATSSYISDPYLKNYSSCRSCQAISQTKVNSPSKCSCTAQVQTASSQSRVPTTVDSSTCPGCHPGTERSFCPHIGSDETDEESQDVEYAHCCKGSLKQKKKSCTSAKKSAISLKPCPSFIRSGSAKTKPPKADPVALYHYYKTLWSQHNLPGENSHEDLRWRIRHRMMAPPDTDRKCLFDGDNCAHEMKQMYKKKRSRKTANKCKCLFLQKICKNCCIKNAPEKRIFKHLKSLEIKFNLSSKKKHNK